MGIRPPIYSGTPSGIVFNLRDGPTIYHTGDTDLFSDMALVPRERAIDYMLVCIGRALHHGSVSRGRRHRAGKTEMR